MKDKVILLVEDNSDDELLTLRAPKNNNIGLYWLAMNEAPPTE